MTGLVVALVLASSSALGPAREAYQSGELARARTALEALLHPLQLKNPTEEAEAHLLLAATYHAGEDPARAEQEVVEGLAVDPDAKLDPLVYPPDFIAFVERVRTVHRQRISDRAAQRRPPVLVPPPATVRPRPATTSMALYQPRPPSRGWYLVPFGVGHLIHGRPTKGTVLAVTQGLTFAVSAASLGTALSLRGPDGRYSAEDARTARGLNISYLVGAYAFAALYAYGVLDGLVLTPEPVAPRGPQG
ncbi:tetratricopeptide repeat protein [Pyxidicoccus xibeiensis]|uniref:hypothetical protein n=1 Tax=Pyxidicoccus xibeiensis TaxID=2906759 RepID=UPI0020A7E122|nr:hypothetical protein [Pyxidicoccus xibeiensis]MCP3137755.1 hypothetical protein [Pyxidicoccus xibeiensis]